MIVVEGPIASGKAAFAKDLAEDLEMLYVPAPTMDDIYINPYGYDMRQLDPQLPEAAKSFDNRNFCLTPNAKNTAQYQVRMMMLRYEKYVDALAHILSTGQGVVTNRCPFSDYVFLETMHKHGYISKLARWVYYEIRANTITEILKPHLVIYLDVPVSKTKENIKKRAIDYEMNSKVFTDQYLGDMETIYKQRYLKEITQHAELLVYDWTNGGETEVVVEDIERIDFDRFDHYDPKMKDWRLHTEWEWCEMRMRFTIEKPDLLNFFSIPRFECPELTRSAEDSKIWKEVWFNAPGMKYVTGYNADMGDKNLLTKTKTLEGQMNA